MKLCFILTTRGNWAKFKHLIKLAKREFEISTIVGGELVLPEKTVGFFDIPATRKVYFSVAGDTPGAMSRSKSLAISEFTNAYEDIRPDLVLVVGDRFETLAAAEAAYICGIKIAHLEGGEVSGSLDDRIRWAITSLADYHFPCTRKAGLSIKKDKVFIVGSTSLDQFPTEFTCDFTEIQRLSGIGPTIDVEKPYLLIIHHPDTSNPQTIEYEIGCLIDAVNQIDMPKIWIIPNMDAGSGKITHALRMNQLKDVHFFKSLPIDIYGPLLNHASCIVGNSSSGIREASFLGTPNVCIGERQKNRECGENTIFTNNIIEGINKQLKHGKYEQSIIYGDGKASEKIMEVLCTLV